jgi:hypothetical protein
MRRIGTRTVLLAALAALSLVLLHSSGRAVAGSCTTTNTVDGSNWNYTRCQVPDVDQVRAEDAANQIWGLPNNGLMYCAPTAAVNFMAYLADQGFPTVSPGTGYWGPETSWPPQPQYTKMTSALATMGASMGTDPYNGTSGAGALLGIDAWLTSSGEGWNFVVSDYNATGFYSPLFNDMAADALGGALVMGASAGTRPTASTTPATAATCCRCRRRSSAAPRGRSASATRPSRTTICTTSPPSRQSSRPSSRRPASSTASSGSWTASRGTARPPSWTTTSRSRRSGPSSPTRRRSTSCTRSSWFGGDSPAQPDSVSYPSGDGNPITDLAIGPEGTKHVYLTAGSDTVWQVDSLTGRSTPFATVSRPEKLVYGGREERLFVLAADRLVALGRDGSLLNTTPLGEPLAAIAFDERADRLVGLTGGQNRLELFDENLAPLGSVAVPPLGCRSRLTMRIDASTGQIVVHCDGATVLTRLTISADRSTVRVAQVPLQGAVAPVGLAVDDQGHAFVSDGGRITDYDPNGRPVTSSPFAGMPGGTNLDVLRSFDNFDAKTMSDRRFRDVLPEDAPRT